MELWTWALAALSIIGTVLNIKKNRASFVIWMVTNSCWAIYDFSIGAYAQGAVFLVYFYLAVWGVIEWAEKKPGRSRAD